MRRAPQLGQNPRRLQLKATRCSWRQPSHLTRREIVPFLHQRVATLSFPLAEGRSNFWEAFQLVPVSAGFWHAGLWFDVFEARHHSPRFAFGLHLGGRFLYTGDTRPIPEILNRFASRGERVFHDCGLTEGPSHTSVSDVRREYTAQQWRRMVFYHYESDAAGAAIESLETALKRKAQS